MILKISNLFNIKRADLVSNNNLCIVWGHNSSGKSLLLKYLYCLYSNDTRKEFKTIFNIDYDEFKKKYEHKVEFQPEKRYRYQPIYIDPAILFTLGEKIIEKIQYNHREELLQRCFGIKLKYDKDNKNWTIILPQDVEVDFLKSSHSVRYISLLHLFLWNGMFNVIMIDNVDLFLHEELIQGIVNYLKELCDMDLKVFITFNNPQFFEYIDSVFGLKNVDIWVSRYLGGKDKFEFINHKFKLEDTNNNENG